MDAVAASRANASWAATMQPSIENDAFNMVIGNVMWVHLRLACPSPVSCRDLVAACPLTLC
jgi:hypothetical protein